MFDWFFTSALSWLSGAATSSLQTLWTTLAATVLTNPDVTLLPQVSTISARSLLVANTCYILFILVAAVLVMTHNSVQIRYGIGDLAPRLVTGLVAANLATPLCSGLIGLANDLTGALTDGPVAGPGAARQMTATITAATIDRVGPTKLLVVVITVLIVVLTVMLLLTVLTRLGILVVLTGIAPAALACHGLPQLDPVARLWWRCMTATLATVTLQAFALHTGLAVFLSPSANLPALGVPGDAVPTINLFIVACLLWATVKIPSLLSKYATRSSGRTPGAYLIRAVIIQQLTRTVRLPARIR